MVHIGGLMRDTTQIIMIATALFLVIIDSLYISKIKNKATRQLSINFLILFTAWMIWQVVF